MGYPYSELSLTSFQALKQRDEERIAVEKNAQRLCDRIRVESQNSMKMLTDVNTKLLNDVSSSKAKITEYARFHT